MDYFCYISRSEVDQLYQMESVFIVLHREPDEVVGTPLYLKFAETAAAVL